MGERFPRPTGSLSARIKGAEIILRERAAFARRMAAADSNPDGQFAASLRGKARGYDEAAELIARLDQGRLLGFRKWTRKATLAPTQPGAPRAETANERKP